jgi:hypothetical protein
MSAAEHSTQRVTQNTGEGIVSISSRISDGGNAASVTSNDGAVIVERTSSVAEKKSHKKRVEKQVFREIHVAEDQGDTLVLEEHIPEEEERPRGRPPKSKSRSSLEVLFLPLSLLIMLCSLSSSSSSHGSVPSFEYFLCCFSPRLLRKLRSGGLGSQFLPSGLMGFFTLLS